MPAPRPEFHLHDDLSLTPAYALGYAFHALGRIDHTTPVHGERGAVALLAELLATLSALKLDTSLAAAKPLRTEWEGLSRTRHSARIGPASADQVLATLTAVEEAVRSELRARSAGGHTVPDTTLSGSAAVGDPVMIRAVTSDDFPMWKPLWDGYNAFYGRAGRTALPGEVTWVTWSRFLNPAEPMHALVAESAGRLIGLAHYLFHRSTIQVALNCLMQDLFTAEAARGMGVGRALIEAVRSAAHAAGSPRLYWHTQETNAVAMRLYDGVAEKSGFIVYRKATQ